MRDHFFERGWCRFPYDPALAVWIEDSLEDARQTLKAPEQAEWLRCGGTWFAGVNALPNDARGAVPGGRPLSAQPGCRPCGRPFAGGPNAAPENWGDVDVTDDYQAARRRAFDACDRVEISAQPGEAYLVHRLALHGVAPWAPGASAGPDGRMICYFRPEVGGPQDWLRAP